MSIDSTYRKILTEEFLDIELRKEDIVSAEELKNKIETLLTDYDLTKPIFASSNYKQGSLASSSASLFNNAQASIVKDLRALYQEMLSLTEVSTKAYERWRLECETIEKQIIDLEDRIENLLLITKDTEGYHSYIVDNFTDHSLIDPDLTTVSIDPVAQIATIAHNSKKDTRIYLNNLDPTKDISFKVRSTQDFISRNDAPRTSLSNIFNQNSSSWWTQITTGKSTPVTCELVVKLAEQPVKLTRIFLSLHDSSRSSLVTVTPLYSVDNFTFKQLPTNTYTQDLRSVGNFSFKEIEAKYIKFLLTKIGPDPLTRVNAFTFQFGFKEISFYTESFDITDTQSLISLPLSIPSSVNQNEKIEFSKVTLDACERIETGTSIDYWITASDDPSVPVTNSTIWVPISPIDRKNSLHPKVIDFSNIEEIELGIEESIGISYNASGSTLEEKNPQSSFHLLSLDALGNMLDEEVTTTSTRYIFTNSEERILSYQIKDSDYSGSGSGSGLTIDEDSLIIFRNVGERGLNSEDSTSYVRDSIRGWKFEDPYYSTVIEILQSEGLTINFGDKPVIIDDNEYSNTVGPAILSGRSPTSSGIHRVKVHKDSWLSISPSLTSLTDIKAEDKLYPFNHKLLIEGYDYPSNYSSSEEKVYTGIDLFASELMTKVNVLDLVGSVRAKQFNFYALDRDAPNSHSGGNEATRVFVVKVDPNTADFSNEKFVLRFNLINQRYKYLRLKANFTTTDEKISPSLDSYKIKLGG